MEKNIKDYLHLYLGCEVQWNGKIKKLSGVETEACRLYSRAFGESPEHDMSSHKNLKPILRPLSDMNVEEAKDVTRIALRTSNIDFDRIITEENRTTIWHCSKMMRTVFYWEDLFWKEDGNEGRGAVELPYRAAFYLLSKHFDLFGLIEAGLAIDKTTIK